MNKNDLYTVDGLGDFLFVVALVFIDYPRTFVCKKANTDDLFLFNEIDFGENWVKWAVTQISYTEFDNLNKGTIPLQGCFKGPRGAARPGFVVESKEGQQHASAICVDRIMDYTDDGEFYVDPFADSLHGAGTLALLSGKPIFSAVLDDSASASPFISAARFEKVSSSFRTVLGKIPFAIDSRKCRMASSCSQSIVLYFEIDEKRNIKKTEDEISLELDMSKESDEALEMLLEGMSEEASAESMAASFQGDKSLVQSFAEFTKELGKCAKESDVTLQVSGLSRGIKSRVKKLNADDLSKISSTAGETIMFIEKTKAKEDAVPAFGKFIMLDNSKTKRFRFIDDSTYGKKTVFSGSSDIEIDTLDLINDYRVMLKSIRYSDNAKPKYVLTKILSKAIPPKQLHLPGLGENPDSD